MKRLTFKLASAALGLALCFGSAASASTLSFMPTTTPLPKPGGIIIVTGPHYVVIVTRTVQQAMLENVNQPAQFDSTN